MNVADKPCRFPHPVDAKILSFSEKYYQSEELRDRTEMRTELTDLQQKSATARLLVLSPMYSCGYIFIHFLEIVLNKHSGRTENGPDQMESGAGVFSALSLSAATL